MPRRDALRAAALFALAGAVAAAAHVMVETPGGLRDWRQTAPLAAVVGGAVGAAARPESALDGLAWSAGALGAFCVLFGVGHALIATAGGAPAGFAALALTGFGGALDAVAGAGGVAALALGAAAGWVCQRRAA